MTPDDALTAYIRQHAAAALDHLACFDEAEDAELAAAMTVEAVHQVRTSLRRLRAARLLIAPAIPLPASVDGDLRSTARALSAVRDTDVLTETLLAEAEARPPGRERAAAREELAAALTARREAGIAQVRRSRSDPRWQRTLDLLRAWCEHAPAEAVERPMGILQEARREVLGRLRAAGDDPAALHSARKAAKRWRYAAELLVPAEPDAAAHFEAATEVHVRLGALQDAVVAEDFLRELVGSSGSDRCVSAAGLLLERARRRLDRELAAAAEVRRDVPCTGSGGEPG